MHRAAERGHTDTEWLRSRHSFSFNEFYDPERMGFGALRVLNDDLIEPIAGFPTHAHKDMEIITIVLSGTLSHKDSRGNSGELHSFDVQRMSAGTGIMHSEMNDSETTPVSLLQLWIEPKEKGLQPDYEQQHVDVPEHGLVVVASDRRDGALYLHQRASVLLGRIKAGQSVQHTARGGIYIFVIDGAVSVAEHRLAARDALELTEAAGLEIEAQQDALVLIVDVPLKA